MHIMTPLSWQWIACAQPRAHTYLLYVVMGNTAQGTYTPVSWTLLHVCTSITSVSVSPHQTTNRGFCYTLCTTLSYQFNTKIKHLKLFFCFETRISLCSPRRLQDQGASCFSLRSAEIRGEPLLSSETGTLIGRKSLTLTEWQKKT